MQLFIHLDGAADEPCVELSPTDTVASLTEKVACAIGASSSSSSSPAAAAVADGAADGPSLRLIARTGHASGRSLSSSTDLMLLEDGDAVQAVPTDRALARRLLRDAGVPLTAAAFATAARDGDAALCERFALAGVAAVVVGDEEEDEVDGSSNDGDSDSDDGVARGRHRPTPLAWAAMLGNMECLEVLLRHGVVDVGYQDGEGQTALHAAARCRRAGPAEALLAAGADVSVADHAGDTPLSIAAQYNCAEAAAVLLAAGADAEACDGYGVRSAMLAGGRQVVEVLAAGGADLGATDRRGRTCVMHAVDAGRYRAALALLDAGAGVGGRDRERRGETLLMIAAARDASEDDDAEGEEEVARGGGGGGGVLRTVVTRALALGADVNEGDVFGATPLYQAVRHHNSAMVDILLQAGADPNAATDGSTGGARTPLGQAARAGWTEAARDLVRCGADVDAAPGGRSALLEAAQSDHLGVVRLLLEAGAVVGSGGGRASGDDGCTLLMYVVRGASGDEAEKLRLVPWLLRRGADANERGSREDTALMVAARGGLTGVVRLLAEEGADLGAVRSDGMSALTLALVYGHWECLRVLRSRHVRAGRGETAATLLVAAAAAAAEGAGRLLPEAAWTTTGTAVMSVGAMAFLYAVVGGLRRRAVALLPF